FLAQGQEYARQPLRAEPRFRRADAHHAAHRIVTLARGIADLSCQRLHAPSNLSDAFTRRGHLQSARRAQEQPHPALPPPPPPAAATAGSAPVGSDRAAWQRATRCPAPPASGSLSVPTSPWSCIYHISGMHPIAFSVRRQALAVGSDPLAAPVCVHALPLLRK